MGMSKMLQSRVSWVRQFPHTALLQVVPRVDVETNQEVATERPKSQNETECIANGDITDEDIT